MPREEALPTNVRFVVQHSSLEDGELQLRRLDPGQGEPVILEELRVPLSQLGGIVYIANPDPPSQPDTSYEVDLGFATHTFTTSSGPDTTAPTLTSSTLAGAGFPGLCTDGALARVETEIEDDFNPPGEALLHVVVTDSDGVELELWMSSEGGFIGDIAHAAIPTGPSVPDARLGVEYTAVVTAYDWAGNASAPSQPLRFQFAQVRRDLSSCGEGPFGCAAADARSRAPAERPLLGALLVFLALLWLRGSARRG